MALFQSATTNSRNVRTYLEYRGQQAGLKVERIERSLQDESFILFGIDPRGTRHALRVSTQELEEMAAAWNNIPTYNTWDTATSTSATTYADFQQTYSVYPQDRKLAKARSAPPANFRAELQQELSRYLRGALA